MTDEEWRSGILRRLSSLEASGAELNRRLAAVETKNAVDEVHRDNVEKRLSGIESTLQWLVRLVFGAIVLALLGYILSGGIVLS